jgi:hypothetical protein
MYLTDFSITGAGLGEHAQASIKLEAADACVVSAHA